jgi:hypothetical protein
MKTGTNGRFVAPGARAADISKKGTFLIMDEDCAI